MITNSCKLCTAGACIVFIEKVFVMKVIFLTQSRCRWDGMLSYVQGKTMS